MIQPSLQIGGGDWAVKETKLLGTNPVLNRKLPVEIDFTNSTIGTRVNKEGFIENGPRNLLTFSEEIDNGAWSKTFSNVATNVSISPNGNLTADRIDGTNTSVNYFRVFRNNLNLTSGIYTFSFYIKNNNLIGYVIVSFLDTSNNNSSEVFNYSSTNLGDWTRVSASINTATTTLNNLNQIRVDFRKVSGNVTGIENIEFWGAQLEQGSTATEYYPTTTRTNIARIDYSSGEAALLIEPQRTNLIKYSQDYSNSSWNKFGLTITANSGTSPTGANDASLLTEDNTNTQRTLGNEAIAVISGVNTNVSVFVKKDTMSFFRLIINRATDGTYWSAAQFNLDTLTFTSGNGTAGNFFVSALIEDFGNGWYKCSLTANLNITDNALAFISPSDGVAIASSDARGRRAYTSANKRLLIFGSQQEVGSYPTSYIPTLASAVTRNADVISKTGISNLIGQTEGAWLFEGSFAAPVLKTNSSISLSDGTGSNVFVLYTLPDQLGLFRIIVILGSVTIFNQSTITIPNLAENFKLAFSYKSGNTRLYVNGVLRASSSLVFTNLILNAIKLSQFNGSGLFEGKAKNIQLYKTALTDAELITLTTL